LVPTKKSRPAIIRLRRSGDPPEFLSKFASTPNAARRQSGGVFVNARGNDCFVADLTGGSHMNQADTAWMLVSTALVLLMTPALAFFYGGLVRSKNALNTMMMSFISLGFVGVAWALL
jgi:hypothetical protein